MIYIYVLLDPRTNEIRYLGKTNDTKERLYGHIYEKGKLGHKYKWIQQLKKNGLKPIIEVLDIVPKEEEEFWEKHYISLLKSWGIRLTNFTDGGNNPPVVRFFGKDNVFVKNKKVREKILAINNNRKGKTYIELYGEEKADELKKLKSEKFSGENNPMFDKKHSKETRDKISKKLIGKSHPQTEETKELIRKKLKGKPKSEITKDRIRIAALKRPPATKETRDKLSKSLAGRSYKGVIYQLEKETKTLVKEWKGFAEINEHFGNKSGNICSCISGNLKSAYGFIWTREKSL